MHPVPVAGIKGVCGSSPRCATCTALGLTCCGATGYNDPVVYSICQLSVMSVFFFAVFGIIPFVPYHSLCRNLVLHLADPYVRDGAIGSC